MGLVGFGGSGGFGDTYLADIVVVLFNSEFLVVLFFLFQQC